MKWTDERVEELKRLWASGLSASQIAYRLGGITRNAVLGKIDRLRIKRSREAARVARSIGGMQQNARMREARARALQTTGVRVSTVADVAQAKIAYAAAVAKMDTESDVARKSLEDLEHGDCRWPVGSPGERGFGFCGDPKMPGVPYCGRHAARAYRHEMPIAGAGVAAGAQTRPGASHAAPEQDREKMDALEGVE